jgi:hypothetical protein
VTGDTAASDRAVISTVSGVPAQAAGAAKAPPITEAATQTAPRRAKAEGFGWRDMHPIVKRPGNTGASRKPGP